ncbi:Chromatin remodeling complex subunit [Colletotrichum higginsianum IMI 349063]|uniref:Chromatin remodeling complex subunit n=2 Tax=Colletotrichum higginsianum (strain IMI 349063) TaxID=759273 RepID=A0A1B7YJN4_COLHI|nr:Chromatin remodeling complex subunit [Colletotrichum higginsianum IMI 349063]OBR12283.1 Chromatin remodeling complex subunit [Colletotrichum higginsianum IMI 349063]
MLLPLGMGSFGMGSANPAGSSNSNSYATRLRPRSRPPSAPVTPKKTSKTASKKGAAATPRNQGLPAHIGSTRTPSGAQTAARAGNMSTQTGKFREDQVLIICPGSQTTMAQLGCGELTPPIHRIPTRMFKDAETDEWRPFHTFKRKRADANGALAIDGPRTEEDEYEWVEDTDSTEGAIYPLKGGRIVNMEAFLAFLDHVHSMLTTTYHNTPIMLMASPQWCRPDIETLARYIFEKTRTPALCMIHSGIATQYGLKWPALTVVDIGYEKVDVTCIHEGRVVNHGELGAPNPERFISGGEMFTRKLLEKLKDKDFTYDMAEQLKKSHICEVLPYAPNAPDLVELPTTQTAGIPSGALIPEAAALAEPAARPVLPSSIEEELEEKVADEGVLDVATIVTSGNARDFLAKKEKEKQKGGRKAKIVQEPEAAKQIRLPNSKRTHNTFHFEEVVMEEVQPPKPEEPKPEEPKPEEPKPEEPKPEATGEPKKEEPVATTETKDVEMTDGPKLVDGAASAPTDGEVRPAETSDPAAPATAPETNGVSAQPAATSNDAVAATNGASQPPQLQAKRVRRDIEVGLERFTFADRGEIDRIVTTIYRTVQGIEDMYMRPACWDNLVFVGNGSRLRGLKDNVLQTLLARHLISPSTATMFTSELPSNLATPTGTGAQTPTGSFTGAPHQLPANAVAGSSGVNPLLQAATTASAQNQGTPGPSGSGDAATGTHSGHHFHSQTPTSIKLATLPTYLSEWNKNGFEEAMFLGAQVAARIAFCQHNLDMAGLEAQRQASLSRVDYNELGPKGVRTHSMLK